MRIVSLTLLAAAWVVGGCSAASSSSAPPPASSHRKWAPSGNIALPASVIEPVVADVAKLAGVPADQVTVISAEAVTFPDGSLGCPQPGMVYTQALVDGYKIVAEAGGKTYDYRGTGSTFRQCTNTDGLTRGDGPVARQSTQLVDQLPDRGGRGVERDPLVGGQLDLEHALDAARPSTTGTPTNSPSTPNSPWSRTAQGRTRFRSRRIASTISNVDAAGA